MAHFAKVENGIVVDLIVIDNNDCGGGNFPQSEELGRQHILKLTENDDRLNGVWFQTSYNTHNGYHYPNQVINYKFNEETGLVEPIPGNTEGAFRLNFGFIGSVFDENAGEHGEFYPPVNTDDNSSIEELEKIVSG
jgi:hypothetical protein